MYFPLCAAVLPAAFSVTGRGAEAFGIKGRGVIAEGTLADICVIDCNNIRRNADCVHPFRRNNGVSHAIVNGKSAVENGAVTGERGGRVVKHSWFNGVDSGSSFKRLGHAQVSTTANIYAHAMEAADQKNADVLANVFLKNAWIFRASWTKAELFGFVWKHQKR